ncbi:MAG TPA: hypothetical protein VL547_05985 [Dinghuibacter sp.]|uniref:hypothetical protein n=1 Tax=Dinghuibacter sp. TaxID=2024697 RepID=UPI002B6B1658|nr:hypothetical protein [Dinghuibacter sp.]HTJ11550.1 hypothetical protein [Dinghuibacter sp.]
MQECFFCGQAPADPGCTIEQPLYRLTRYAHLGLVRRFEYDKLVIPVGRCAACARIGAQAKKKRKVAIAVGSGIGFLIGLPIPGAFVFTAIGGGFAGYLAARSRTNKMYDRLNIRAPEAVKEYPPVAERLNGGWTLKK